MPVASNKSFYHKIEEEDETEFVGLSINLVGQGANN